MTTTAETKSRVRSVRTSPRTRRAGTNHENAPRIRLSSRTVALYLVASTRTMNRNGIESRMSTRRISAPSIRPPGNRSVERPDHGRDQRCEEADRERRLAPLHDPAELVKAVLVGAERMCGA